MIPRPASWRPGGPVPWAGLPVERRRPAIADVRVALAAAPAPRPVLTADPDGRPSAVLAALYEQDGEAVVVLTRRARNLRAHRGEVSFPGGRQEPGEDLVSTALREAHEEIGLDPGRVEIIGELDHLRTVMSRSYIAPFVGVLDRRPALAPNPHEVDLVLHVPLSELLSDGVCHSERWQVSPAYSLAAPTPPEIGSDERELWFFDLVGDTVWGATASMLGNLLALVTGVATRSGSTP